MTDIEIAHKAAKLPIGEVAKKIGLKGPRTRQLLNELVNKELLACIGTTKRRRYIKHMD